LYGRSGFGIPIPDQDPVVRKGKKDEEMHFLEKKQILFSYLNGKN
jgi:hypothetical protein